MVHAQAPPDCEVRDLKEQVVLFCSENRGKFDQIRLQLEFWADGIRDVSKAGRAAASIRSVHFSAEEDASVSIGIRFAEGHRRRVRIDRRPDIGRSLGPEPQLESFAEIAACKARAAAAAVAGTEGVDADDSPGAPTDQMVVGVAVQDSGLSIRALHDFPGPFTKYVTQTIGMRGLLKLMDGESDRACGFDGCIAFVAVGPGAPPTGCSTSSDEGGLRLFHEPKKHWGRLATWEESGFLPAQSSRGGGVVAAESVDRLGDGAPGAAQRGPNEAGAADETAREAKSKWTVAAAGGKLGGPDRNAFTVFIPEDLPPGLEAGRTLMQMTPEELLAYRRERHSCYRDFAQFVFEDLLGVPDAIGQVPAASLSVS